MCGSRPDRHSPTRSTRAHHVGHVDVGLALRAVAQDRAAESDRRATCAGSRSPTPWVWRGPTTLPNRNAAATRPNMCAVGADHRLAGELAGAVRRHRQHRPVVLGGLQVAELAVDAASRGVQEVTAPGLTHGLDHADASKPCPRRSRPPGRSSPWRCPGLDARWIARSWPSTAAVSASGSATSPRTTRRRRRPASGARSATPGRTRSCRRASRARHGRRRARRR